MQVVDSPVTVRFSFFVSVFLPPPIQFVSKKNNNPPLPPLVFLSPVLHIIIHFLNYLFFILFGLLYLGLFSFDCGGKE